MRIEPVYFVIGCRIDNNALSSRTFGFYHEIETARKAVELNIGDINESGYYPWVLIEKHLPGFYQIARIKESEFYVWEENKYVKSDMPQEFIDYNLTMFAF